MKDYSIYYSYKSLGDVIVVIFDDEKVTTRTEQKGRVVVIYNNDEIIGYNILDVKDIIKIKSSGLIYFPTPEMIGVINSILSNEKLPTLDYVTESGYYVAEIVEINNDVVTLSLGNETVHALMKKGLKVGDKVVVVKAGQRLNSGDIVRTSDKNGTLIDGHICTNRDLTIEDNDDYFVIDEELENGQDFFVMEENN